MKVLVIKLILPRFRFLVLTKKHSADEIILLFMASLRITVFVKSKQSCIFVVFCIFVFLSVQSHVAMPICSIWFLLILIFLFYYWNLSPLICLHVILQWIPRGDWGWINNLPLGEVEHHGKHLRGTLATVCYECFRSVWLGIRIFKIWNSIFLPRCSFAYSSCFPFSITMRYVLCVFNQWLLFSRWWSSPWYFHATLSASFTKIPSTKRSYCCYHGDWWLAATSTRGILPATIRTRQQITSSEDLL